MKIPQQHQPMMGEFFQTNITGREQREPGSGLAWLVEFWFRSEEDQLAEIAKWADVQKAALQAQTDQQVAALESLRADAGGSRIEMP